MSLRQVQAVSLQGHHLRQVRRRGDAVQGASGADGAHQASVAGQPRLVFQGHPLADGLAPGHVAAQPGKGALLRQLHRHQHRRGCPKEYLSKSSPQRNDRVIKLQEERDVQVKELKDEVDARVKAKQDDTKAKIKTLEEELDETVDEMTSRAKELVDKIKAQKGKKAATNFTIGEGADEEVFVPKGTLCEDKLARELPKQVEKN